MVTPPLSYHIICFQVKKKDMYNCQVDILHYQPGYRTQRKLTKKEVKEVLRTQRTACIALNWPPTHFSAIVPAVHVESRPKRRGHDFPELSNGVIDVGGDDD